MKHRISLMIPIMILAITVHAGAFASTRLIVLNEVLDATTDVDHSVPLYLSRLGSYYAELYLEPGVVIDIERTVPLDLAFTVSFLRREELVLSKEVAISLEPGQDVATLFYLHSPYDLPQRKGLDVVVNFHDVDPHFKEYYEAVRLQLTRKAQLAPRFIR